MSNNAAPQSIQPSTIEDPDFVMSEEVQTEYERGVVDGIAKREALADEVMQQIGWWENQCALQMARVETLESLLEFWIYDGRLQTFEDRERFRRAARAALPQSSGVARTEVKS